MKNLLIPAMAIAMSVSPAKANLDIQESDLASSRAFTKVFVREWSKLYDPNGVQDIHCFANECTTTETGDNLIMSETTATYGGFVTARVMCEYSKDQTMRVCINATGAFWKEQYGAYGWQTIQTLRLVWPQ
jgi:hypothetical protein